MAPTGGAGRIGRVHPPRVGRRAAERGRARAPTGDARLYPGEVTTWDPERILDRLRATDLPVAAHLGEIGDALAHSRTLVLQAPPGSGKTALVPAALAAWQTARQGRARIVCTQPRRVAARAAAQYAATLTGAEVGGAIGYTVRGDSRASREGLVEFVTAGIATRRLAGDPFASEATAIILDEVHERSLDTDLACAFAAEAQRARDDLVVIAMSATLDAERFARLLGDRDPAPIVTVEAPTHPLTIDYAPAPRGVSALDARGVTPAFLGHVATVARSEAARGRGDVLVFVPGAREVDEVARRIGSGNRDLRVERLHGSLPFDAQQRVLERGSGQAARVVVATALAESALTIPGVRSVVDSGLARVPRLDHARGMASLATVACSRASATQRAGRAAREAPGRAIRCFEEAEWARRPAYPDPQIAVSDLADAVLTLAAWGAPGGEGLTLVEPLPAAGLAQARATLEGLGALDESGAITDVGQRLHAVPADPRLARALLEGAERTGARLAGEVVAALAERARTGPDDLTERLARLRRGDDPAARNWRTQADRFARLAPRGRVELEGVDAVAWIVALAYPQWLARRRAGAKQGARSLGYALASGSGAAVPEASALAGSEWLAVADVTRATGTLAATSGALIRAAVPICEDDALRAGRHLCTETVVTEIVDATARAWRVSRLGAIDLGRRRARPDADSIANAIDEAIGLGRILPGPTSLLTWSDEAIALRERLAVLHEVFGEPWPDVSSSALTRDAHTWLAPAWQALAAGRPIPATAVLDGLRHLLPWPEAGRLDELAPRRLELPTGRSVALDYSGPAPTAAAKLQECFGWADNPRIGDGRVVVVLDLLDPAGRVLAHTGDLRFFWDEVYAQVRSDMRGRYPKHPWPEDPWSATPTARTNRRR